jgi:hypothetical protein
MTSAKTNIDGSKETKKSRKSVHFVAVVFPTSIIATTQTRNFKSRSNNTIKLTVSQTH